MSIYQKGGAWYIRVQVAGRRIERSVGKGATRKQALELEARIKDKLHTTAHDGRMGRRPKRLFDDALIKWVEEYARFRRDYDKLKSHINNAIPFVEGMLLTDVVEAAEAMKQAMLAKGLKPATINRRLAVIRQVLNAAYRDWDWLDTPLGDKIRELPERNERHVYLTEDQVASLANACTNPFAAELIWVGAYTGLRRGELLRLTKDNIQNGYIVLDSKTKTGRPRLIPIHEKIADTISKLPLPISDAQLRKQWDKARMQTGLTGIRFHDLRHTFASWLAANGAQATDIRDLLGHTNLKTTSRYTHLLGRHLKRVVNRIGRKN